MTAAVLGQAGTNTTRPACPSWCRNNERPVAFSEDMCDAGLGEWRHMGRTGTVVLPSRVNEFYDEEIGVELFQSPNRDGSGDEPQMLLTYSSEYQERGHVTLSIPEARRLVAFTRSDATGERRERARFGEPDANNLLIEQPIGHLPTRVDMNIEGKRCRIELHPTQVDSLADAVATACLLAEVTR